MLLIGASNRSYVRHGAMPNPGGVEAKVNVAKMLGSNRP
jgi:hypothetical protein